MIAKPIMIFCANVEQIKKVYERVLSRNVKISIFTEEIFSAIYDEESRVTVKKVQEHRKNCANPCLYLEYHRLDQCKCQRLTSHNQVR